MNKKRQPFKFHLKYLSVQSKRRIAIAFVHGVAYSSLKESNMCQCPLVVSYDRWSDDIYVVTLIETTI